MMAPVAFGRVWESARRRGCGYLLGPGFRRAEALYQKTQWLSREQIGAGQWARLPDLLDWACRSSAFYRDRLANAGRPVTPETFRRVPALTKRDLEALAGAGGRLQGGLRRSSGGSGGAAVTIPLDRETYGWYIAGTWRGLRWWGVEPTDRAVLLLGRSAGSPIHALAARAKDWLLNWRRIGIDGQFDLALSPILREIGAFRPTFLYGYPSAVHRLAAAAATGGWKPRRRLRLVVLTGEPIYTFQRRAIETIFQCPVAEEYGSGELGCLAFECPHGRLHSTAESVLLEVVAEPAAAPNAPGRILATHLRNRLLPLIRYEIGDLGALDTDRCGCGRGLPTLRVLGRAHGQAPEDQDTARSHRLLDEFFNSLPNSMHGRVRVARGPAGILALQVERGAASDTEMVRVAAAGTDILASGRRVTIEELERLPRLASGKLPYVVAAQR